MENDFEKWKEKNLFRLNDEWVNLEASSIADFDEFCREKYKEERDKNLKAMDEKQVLLRTAIGILISKDPYGNVTKELRSISTRPEIILTPDEIKVLDILIKERLCYHYDWLSATRERNPNRLKAKKIEVELLNRAIDVLKEKPSSVIITFPETETSTNFPNEHIPSHDKTYRGHTE